MSRDHDADSQDEATCRLAIDRITRFIRAVRYIEMFELLGISARHIDQLKFVIMEIPGGTAPADERS